MLRLRYLRFLTYGFFIAALYLAERRHTFIPVELSNGPLAPALPMLPPRDTATREPDFEATKLSGSEVLRLATEHVRRRGIELSGFGECQIRLLHSPTGLNWMVAWPEKGVRKHIGPLGVIVTDATGETTDLPGFETSETNSFRFEVQRGEGAGGGR
jgi:hypothetical protein